MAMLSQTTNLKGQAKPQHAVIENSGIEVNSNTKYHGDPLTSPLVQEQHVSAISIGKLRPNANVNIVSQQPHIPVQKASIISMPPKVTLWVLILILKVNFYLFLSICICFLSE